MDLPGEDILAAVLEFADGERFDYLARLGVSPGAGWRLMGRLMSEYGNHSDPVFMAHAARNVGDARRRMFRIVAINYADHLAPPAREKAELAVMESIYLAPAEEMAA